MKNLKKFLAIFLSIAMVMCSTLPSFASETETTIGASEETVGASEEIVESSEETLVDETSRGEACEPAEEEAEESESDYAEEPEEDETTAAVEESEEDETTVAVEESEEDETTAAVEESEENETTVAVEESEEDETTAVAEEETSDNNVGASSTSPEEESESTEETESIVGDDILSSHDETTESLSKLKATKSEIVSEEKLLGATSTPWMYYYIENGNTIRFTNTNKSGATGVTDDDYIRYSGFNKADITRAIFDNQINAVTCYSFFDEFVNLETIDNLEYLITEDVEYMTYMFRECEELESLNLSNFNTSNVKDMEEMFYRCQSLTILDLSSFNTANLLSMQYIFYYCALLETIIVSDNFVTDKVSDSGFFKGATKLVGGNGTAQDESKIDLAYARIDEPGNPGYFSKAPWMYWYLTDNDTTIHFTKNKPASGENGLTRRDIVFYKGLESYKIKKAIFEDEIEATTCAYLFYGFTILKEIIDLDKYKVDKVTSMKQMFKGCHGLEELDLSSFNTSNVEYMERMFESCSKLMTIIISSNFVTTKVSDNGAAMFENCPVLSGCNGTSYEYPNCNIDYARIDGGSSAPGYFSSAPWMYWYLSDSDETIHYTNTKPTSGDYEIMTRRDRIVYNGLEDTQRENIAKAEFDNNINAETCSNFFQGFSQLKNIVGIEKLNTSNVVRMDSMFEGCSAITMLDLNSFNTSNVELMKKMFYNCRSLVTIIASDEFRTTKVSDDGEGMFSLCDSLVGCYGTGAGTSLVYNKGYAHIDEGISNRGYFSSAPWMYWYLTDSNHTIHYTSSKPTSGDYEIMTRRDRIVYNGLEDTQRENITKAEFDNNITAATCAHFFENFSCLEVILDLYKLDTQNVESMMSMFIRCSQLVGLDLSNFNTSNVTSMGYMFYNCSSLISLDLNKFDTSNVTITQYMFCGCSSLTKIRVSNSFVTTSVTIHGNMFTNCTNLVGGAGTTYDGGHTGKEYAHIDGGTAAPGYFTDVNWMYWYLTDEDGDSTSETIHFSSINPGGATAINCGAGDRIEYVGLAKNDITKAVFDNEINAETCAFLFANFSKLETINSIEKLKTNNVINMEGAFYSCSSLEIIDLRSFDTSKVGNIDTMFSRCSSLEKIIVSNNFVTTRVVRSEDMFYDCQKLVGAYYTTYDSRHIDKEYARIDRPNSPGYFSTVWMWWYLEGTNKIRFSGTKPSTGSANEVSIHRVKRMTYEGITKEDIKVAEFDNEINAISCYNFFDGFTNLGTIIGIENLKTNDVTKMAEMFRNCKALVKLDLSGFDTTRVNDMSRMFSGCESLTELNLSSFKTENVTNMQYMFQNCSLLKTIMVSDKFITTNLGDTGKWGIFRGCTSIVGGKGTVYDSNYEREEYARIDGGPTNPGYFTLYVPPAPPTPPAPYYPGGSSGSRGSSGGGGGGGGGGPVTEDAPAVTYLPYVKSIVGFANNLMSKWSQDAMSSKWKLSVTAENGSETNLKNGFVLYTHISTQIVGNTSVQTAANNTYVFDENGNMITGWVHTADGKTYFFENKKTSDEGKMIIGWKQIQGSWYCFGPDGAMYKDTITPDGHPVGPDGKWRG